MDGLHFQVSADKLTLTITSPGAPDITCDATQVDEMIRGLGILRAAMLPEPPRQFALGQRVACVTDPSYATEPEALQGDSLVHLRHPGFGWLSFLFPRGEAAKLAGFLHNQAAQEPVLSGKTVN
ncbi:MAG: hypothetical protein P4M15_11155 [Alphaproteobacteria bacterium]|nr:hypothetical protein [Alphaproteobacteria bacterium]